MTTTDQSQSVDASWCFEGLPAQARELLCLAFLEEASLDELPLGTGTLMELKGRLSRLQAMEDLDALSLVLSILEELAYEQLSLPEIGIQEQEE